jgi:Photosynthesis system II assembly factor YCF48
MPEFSNLLRQRLGLRTAPWVDRKAPAGKVNGETAFAETAVADAHPDPDTLTAYAERLLCPEERNLVLQHLAACEHCREVVMLTLPEPEAAAKAAVALPAGRGWRGLLTPRWGLAASAVAVAVVVGVVVQSPRKSAPAVENATQAQNEKAAKQEVAPAVSSLVAPAAPSLLAPASPSLLANDGLEPSARRFEPRAGIRPSTSTLSPTRGNESRDVYDVRTTASSADAVNGPVGGITGYAGEDYLNAGMFSYATTPEGSNIANKDLPPAPAPRPANPWSLIPPSTQIPDFTGLASSAPGATQRATFTPPRKPGHTLVGGFIHVFQKQPQPPISATGLGFSAMGGTGALNPTRDKNQSVEMSSAAPAIDGAAGDELARAPAFTSRARAAAPSASDADMKAGASQLYWKIAGGKLLKFGDSGAWAEAYPDNGIEFSTFAAHGAEIWAGGRDAALIHSRDGGTTWERITLGAAASGTIIKIEAGALSVQVKSSSGQSWLSLDGGKSWARQD